MSKENTANQIFKQWQQHIQDTINDPNNAKIMIDNIAKLKEFNEKIQSQVMNENTHSNDDNNGDAKLHELELKLTKLETRIELLERNLARYS